MTNSTFEPPSHARIELAETAAWLDALYSRCTADDGVLSVVAPSRKKCIGWYPIGSGDRLVRIAKVINGKRGLYLKINLLDRDAMHRRAKEQQKPPRYVVGSRDEVKTIVAVPLDVDAGKTEKYPSRADALAAVNAMPHPPSLIVNSNGSNGGFHVYWILDQPHRISGADDRRRISNIATRWQKRLAQLVADVGGDLDATANIDRILRVVGGRRKDGGRVSCHAYYPDRLYTIDDLTLPPDEKEIEREIDRQYRQVLGPILSSDQPITAFLDAAGITPEVLLSEEGYSELSDGEWMRPGSETGRRSLKLANKLDRPGINVFSGSDPVFPCTQRDGSIGQFYSVDEMFVRLRHGGDWKATARWCYQQIDAFRRSA